MNQPELIRYETHGEEGPWLVFIHGLTCDRTDWAPQIEALSDSYRCVAVDTRGHGESADLPPPYNVETDASDLARLLDLLHVTDAILIGHSRGVRVATATALLAPHTTGGLVFVDGSQQGFGDPDTARKQIFDRIESSPSVDAFTAEMFAAMFPAGTPAVGRTAIESRAVGMRKAAFLEFIGDMVRWDAGQFEDALANLEQPVGVVQGTTINENRERRSVTAGEVTPFLEMIQENCQEVVLNSVPDTGHFVQLDTPGAVTDMIRQIAQRKAH
jgi:pimeloyl-ACP methyl ester carboxylesterase